MPPPATPEPFPGRHPGWPARLGPLATPRGVVRLRPPHLRDARAWSRTRVRDRAYLQRWEPTSLGNWQERHAALAWPGQWATLRGTARRGEGLSFVIAVDGEFAGQLSVGNIVRGALRSGWIGYWVTERLAGGGIATCALAMAVDHCFGPVGLHRLEATVRPENGASIRVLEKVGFRREGLFERYLDVAGQWRDHFVYGLTAEETGAGVVASLLARGWAHRPE
ncbi:GNAT family N-acetyltransferase [Bounagaea algeriensis]